MGILRAGISWERKRGLVRRERRRARFAPRVEGLEGRALLAVLTVTSNADSGMGSLRAAVAAAGDGDTINFDPSLNGDTITLTGGEIDITKNLTIFGRGEDQLTISGDNKSSIFAIPREIPDPSDPGGNDITLPPLSVAISGFTLQDAKSPLGGAIYEANHGGTLSVSKCRFTDNLVTKPITNGAIDGGAIYSTAQLSVDQCTFLNNQVQGVPSSAKAGWADFSSGGAIEEDGDTLTVTNSTFTYNHVLGADGTGGSDAYGGAVAMRSGYGTTITATITGNTFTGNTASGGNSGDTATGGAASGGAVYILSNAQKGTVYLSDNTFGGDHNEGANSAFGGNGRNGGSAEGGSITLDDGGSKGVAFDVFNTHINSSFVVGGNSVGGTTAGNGGVARGGAIALQTGSSVTTGDSTGALFDLEQVSCEDSHAYGGKCGDSTDAHAPLYRGGTAYGGGVYYFTAPTQSPHLILETCQFTDDSAIGGNGGSAPAAVHNRNRPLTSFAGGNANGGGLAVVVELSQSPTFIIADTTFQQCTAQGGNGGHGVDFAAPNTNFEGGPGGKALGGGMAFLNGPSIEATLNMRNCKFLTNSANGGAGGYGGDQGMSQDGGDGGIGGAASGGGLEIQRIGGNPGPAGPINYASFVATVAGSSFSGNQALGGGGGKGGVGLTGGAGGTGGRAQGGGACIDGTNGNPFDFVHLEDDSFVNVTDPEQTSNVAQGGGGGGGGQGLGQVALGGAGGNGGLGAGGGVYTQFSGEVLFENGVIAHNRAAGGGGGNGGDYNGAVGHSNFGYGGGIWAHDWPFGGLDLRTGNLVIDMNVADVNPDVDGILGSF
jgi:hypothetical protein